MQQNLLGVVHQQSGPGPISEFRMGQPLHDESIQEICYKNKRAAYHIRARWFVWSNQSPKEWNFLLSLCSKSIIIMTRSHDQIKPIKAGSGMLYLKWNKYNIIGIKLRSTIVQNPCVNNKVLNRYTDLSILPE